MKCPKCGGKGKTTEYDGLRKFWCDYKCEMCNGTGEVMTEQEYLQTCTTGQLAEWIVHLADDCTMQHECDLCNSWCDEKRVMEWLKQPHTFE